MSEESNKRENRRKFLQGTVVSDKMEKTCVVRIDWSAKHDKYHKIVRRHTKYKAHDEKNEAKMGDIVRIMETRRLSKDKRWILRDIVEKAAE